MPLGVAAFCSQQRADNELADRCKLSAVGTSLAVQKSIADCSTGCKGHVDLLSSNAKQLPEKIVLNIYGPSQAENTGMRQHLTFVRAC